MCMTCIAQAELVAADVLPGFSLYRGTAEAEGWPVGWYGLVKVNDPMLVFPGPLLKDACEGMTEDDLDVQMALPDGYEAYEEACTALGLRLVLPANQGYELVQAAQARGYDVKAHGDLQWWLLDHLAGATSAATA